MRREAAPIADSHVLDIVSRVLPPRPLRARGLLPGMLMALNHRTRAPYSRFPGKNRLAKAAARVAVRNFPATARLEMVPPGPPHAKAEAAGPVESPGIRHDQASSRRPPLRYPANKPLHRRSGPVSCRL